MASKDLKGAFELLSWGMMRCAMIKEQADVGHANEYGSKGPDLAKLAKLKEVSKDSDSKLSDIQAAIVILGDWVKENTDGDETGESAGIEGPVGDGREELGATGEADAPEDNCGASVEAHRKDSICRECSPAPDADSDNDGSGPGVSGDTGGDGSSGSGEPEVEHDTRLQNPVD